MFIRGRFVRCTRSKLMWYTQYGSIYGFRSAKSTSQYLLNKAFSRHMRTNRYIIIWSPCQFPLQNHGARAPDKLFFYYAILRLLAHGKLAYWFYRGSIFCFWFYRGPLLGFWTKHLRNCNSDSIEDKVFRQKADFVDCVSFNKLSK